MQPIYDVIIIGAGISGIGASSVLSKHNCPHIILESRDRIGGRIHSKHFDGITIDTGASFVHQPHHNNQIKKIMDKLAWKSHSAQYQNQQYLYEFTGRLDPKTVSKAENLYEKLLEYSQKNVSQHNKDISVYQAAKDFIEHQLAKQSDQVQKTVRWLFQIEGNIEGAELQEMSARQFIEGKDAESQHDLLPIGGYAKLLQTIFDQHHPTVIFNQKVVKIDYHQQVVTVYTQDNLYKSRKVISSLPLGILLSKTVEFHPQLPKDHLESLSKIGNGVANKLFVSFQQPFWSVDKTWLNFVTSKPSKYPVAFNMSTKQTYILCVFVSGKASKQISQLSNQSIIEDFLLFLQQFYPNAPLAVRDFQVTRWHQDQHSLGSYSYMKIGSTEQDINIIKKPIHKKVWFIGEHCHPQMNACAHAAFQTGLWAANEVLNILEYQE